MLHKAWKGEIFATRLRCILPAAMLFVASTWAAGSHTVKVTLDNTTTVWPIPAGFLGLSFEKHVLQRPVLKVADKNMVNLFKMLGPSVLRIGGNAVDFQDWVPDGKKSGTATADIQDLNDFLKAINWKVLYGVGLGPINLAKAPDEAWAAHTILGDRLQWLELGNEIDHYGDSPSGLYPGKTKAEIRALWEGADKAVVAKFGSTHAPISGPGTSCDCLWVTDWKSDFPAIEHTKLDLFTFHHYGRWNPSDVATLLSPDAAFEKAVAAVHKGASSAKPPLPIRMTETNTVNGGGQGGVSDGIASALWALDYMFMLDTNGFSGVNFHTIYNTTISPYYTPIQWDHGGVQQIRPLYYAMAMFAKATGVWNLPVGKTPPAATLRHPTIVGKSLSAWTVNATDYSVILVNDDTQESAVTTVTVGAGYAAVDTFSLLGNLHDPNKTTMGGATIGLDASWSPVIGSKAVAGGAVTVTLAPASAMMVTFRKSSAAITFSLGTDKSHVYGDAAFKLTASVTGGGAVSFASSDPTVISVTGSTATIVGVGTASITASSAGATPVVQAATITSKAISVTGVKASNKVYDGTVTATLSAGTLTGIVTGDKVTLTQGTGKFATADAGTAKAVTVSGFALAGTDAPNYTLTPLVGVTANITPAPLSIKADDAVKYVGDPDPAFTATYTGFVNKETKAVVTGLVFKRVPGSAVGTYAITPSGASAANYAITYVNGSLTIKASTGIINLPRATVSRQLEAKVPNVFAHPALGTARGNIGVGLAECSEVNSCLSVDVLLPAAGSVSISIYDNLGTRVISFAKNIAPFDLGALHGSGDGRWVLPVSWNLRASNGIPVPAGVYLWEVDVQTNDGQKLQSVHKLGVKE